MEKGVAAIPPPKMLFSPALLSVVTHKCGRPRADEVTTTLSGQKFAEPISWSLVSWTTSVAASMMCSSNSSPPCVMAGQGVQSARKKQHKPFSSAIPTFLWSLEARPRINTLSAFRWPLYYVSVSSEAFFFAWTRLVALCGRVSEQFVIYRVRTCQLWSANIVFS